MAEVNTTKEFNAKSDISRKMQAYKKQRAYVKDFVKNEIKIDPDRHLIDCGMSNRSGDIVIEFKSEFSNIAEKMETLGYERDNNVIMIPKRMFSNNLTKVIIDDCLVRLHDKMEGAAKHGERAINLPLDMDNKRLMYRLIGLLNIGQDKLIEVEPSTGRYKGKKALRLTGTEACTLVDTMLNISKIPKLVFPEIQTAKIIPLKKPSHKNQ